LASEYVLVGAHNDHDGMLETSVDHDSLRAFNRVMRPQGANDRPGPPTAAQQQRIDSLIAYARSIRPPRRDSVMNGADDDGSGTVVLLEIAERFATGPAPKRSIVFISHAAEEEGLLGSRYFTDHPTIPRERIVAAHNMDMVGNGAVTDVRFGGPAQVQMLGARRLSAEFGDMIDSINAVRPETMAIDYSWDRTNALNRFCRSDQVSYFRHNIPVTYFSTGYSIDYHQATDEPQYIDYEKSARVGRFVHEIMSAAANRATRLALLPPDQRDLSSRC
jgi:Zn-dependent M28 family amino/carboxypeptidase